jgi:hypothetical protein
VSRLQVVDPSLPHPLKVANVIVRLNLTRMLAPIFALVPIVHFLFPASMSRGLDLILRLCWAPVGWSPPGSSPAPLPGGVWKRLSLFGRLGLGRSLRNCLDGRAAPAISESSPLVSG